MTTEDKLKIAIEALTKLHDHNVPNIQYGNCTACITISKIGDINEPVETRKPREFWIKLGTEPKENQFVNSYVLGFKPTNPDFDKTIHVIEVLEPSEPKYCEIS